MKKIPIRKHPDLFLIVDDEDYDYMSQYNWILRKNRGMNYTSRNVTKKEQKELNLPTLIFSHRVIMGVLHDKTVLIDHKDHNGLNNQKSNLRVCTGHENQGNRRKIKTFTSIHKGVFFHATRNKWVAHIKNNSKREYLGYFKTEEEAATAYNNRATLLFGDFALLNNI